MAKRDDIKKVNDISNEGSRYNNLKSTAKVANITERFDDTTHNDNPYDDAIQYLSLKIEDVIEESNLQGTASGSYATDIKTLTLASGSLATNVNTLTTASSSFSTRVTTNDAKVSMVIGTRATEAKAGNTTTISTEQASLITALAKGVTNSTGHNVKLTLNEAGSLVISINRSTYTISADG